MRFARLAAMATLAFTLLTAPLALEAQHTGKVARIGILWGAAPAFRPDTDPSDRAIVVGLRDHGYVVGQNALIEFRSARAGPLDVFPGLAADLVGLGVDVIVTSTEPGVTAARDASRSIPIVMAAASIDHVASGFVASLARPGGNVTGVTLGDIAGKRVELLRDALPGLRSVAAFHGDPSVAFVAQWLRATQTAAQRLGLAVHPVRVPLPNDPLDQWERVFETVARRGIGAITIQESPRFELHRQLLADLAIKHRLPMVFTFRNQAEAGGLMAFTADHEEVFRGVGGIVARILKGAEPADLPVEEPTKYQLVLNLKTAKTFSGSCQAICF